ncbi:MAG: Chromosome segregation and condensation protein ScpA [Candidatus Magasanikbacteria bacterium GW2011_GWA2_56_11]|uniref:Segregation and condensation protein A n=1 Tax=Candidatus Magasanikbacteria bacterium GW2011_GWA2_56_11 TaxID=1619044 RepID=A0A0G2ALY0_9BACT|nr:MAG: Chromosome segregation and condensation protein ScpA [Candidatus Magasanikbacteria bacterium GW2011_GWA2_56_11]
MTTHFTLKEFSGPLDLLLSLIAEKKMDVGELAISDVTEQFLAYLDTLEEKRPEEVADFLVIATRLLLLKAKTLLPQLSADEDAGPSLADQLRLYKRFVEASRELDRRWLSPERSVGRVEPPRVVVRPEPPVNFSPSHLEEAMRRLVSRLRLPKPLPHTTIDRAVSLKEKLDAIRTLLTERRAFTFFGDIAHRQNRTDLIVSFLALLELMKQRLVALEQPAPFGDITINRGGAA